MAPESEQGSLSYDLPVTLPINTFSAHISQSWLPHIYSQEPSVDQSILNTHGILTALGVAEITGGYELNNSLSALGTEE